MQLPHHCTLCPRACGADRAAGQRGLCGADDTLRVARAALHHWEEPCLSGDPSAETGSGTVFFSGCTLRCCYCQNYPISQGEVGKEISVERLAEIFMNLQNGGAKNLNLVTASQYLPWVTAALDQARTAGFCLPVVYNTGGYETVEAVKALAGRTTSMRTVRWLPSFPPRRTTLPWPTPPFARCFCRPVRRCTMRTAIYRRVSLCGIWRCPAMWRTARPFCSGWPHCGRKRASHLSRV